MTVIERLKGRKIKVNGTELDFSTIDLFNDYNAALLADGRTVSLGFLSKIDSMNSDDINDASIPVPATNPVMKAIAELAAGTNKSFGLGKGILVITKVEPKSVF